MHSVHEDWRSRHGLETRQHGSDPATALPRASRTPPSRSRRNPARQGDRNRREPQFSPPQVTIRAIRKCRKHYHDAKDILSASQTRTTLDDALSEGGEAGHMTGSDGRPDSHARTRAGVLVGRANQDGLGSGLRAWRDVAKKSVGLRVTLRDIRRKEHGVRDDLHAQKRRRLTFSNYGSIHELQATTSPSSPLLPEHDIAPPSSPTAQERRARRVDNLVEQRGAVDE